MTPENSTPMPVFVIGSPRSGTSILTWCLGQHSNLLPLEESAWMGDFAADVGARHLNGSRRGERSQLVALGVSRDALMAGFGEAIDRTILAHGQALGRAQARDAARFGVNDADARFRLLRTQHERKRRWVDGTPEYSFHVFGLGKLFPQARFIHIVRDVEAVVASMLNFHHVEGQPLVADANAAYAYWYAAANACHQAECALGSGVMHRVRYTELIANPQIVLREVLAFLGEDFEPACLEPLEKRINSSRVPENFRVDTTGADTQQWQRAAELNRLLRTTPQNPLATSSARAELEAAFDARVAFVAGLDEEYARAQQLVRRLQHERNERTAWALRLDRLLQNFGWLWVAQALLVAVAALLGGLGRTSAMWLALWLAVLTGTLGACAFAWLRREKLRAACLRIVTRRRTRKDA
jgi:hypothetical protein